MNPEFVWDFEIQTDHLISPRRPDQVIINEKKNENLPNRELCCPGRPQSQNKRKKKKNKYLDLAREQKKSV